MNHINELFISNSKKVQHLEDLDELKLTTGDYIIGASAACIVLGMDIINSDLDICLTTYAYNKIKNKLYPGKKDGVHDNMFQNKNGTIDITYENTPNWFKFSEYFPYSWVINNHRYLNYDGCLKFYTYLYNLRHKEKHLKRLQWLQENKHITINQ